MVSSKPLGPLQNLHSAMKRLLPSWRMRMSVFPETLKVAAGRNRASRDALQLRVVGLDVRSGEAEVLLDLTYQRGRVGLDVDRGVVRVLDDVPQLSVVHVRARRIEVELAWAKREDILVA